MALSAILNNVLKFRWYEHIPVLYKSYEYSMVRDIQKYPVPQHIAVIQDGNRRFAKMRGESVEKGHFYGADTTERVLKWCQELGVRQLTLYAFSTENFKRSESEKKTLFELLKLKFKESRESQKTHKSKLRIRFMGDISMLPEDVRKEVELTDEATKGYDKFFLNIALAYGGRQELVDSARKIAKAVQGGTMQPGDVTEATVDGFLYLDKDPKNTVDLIIRTGGDERTSNFLPWQASGNESAIYICAPYWPEFRKIDFLRAIRAYQMREREHKVRVAVRMIKLKRQNGGVKLDELKSLLAGNLNIDMAEVETILSDKLVKKELAKAKT